MSRTAYACVGTKPALDASSSDNGPVAAVINTSPVKLLKEKKLYLEVKKNMITSN